jgi:hypothetical protein
MGSTPYDIVVTHCLLVCLLRLLGSVGFHIGSCAFGLVEEVDGFNKFFTRHLISVLPPLCFGLSVEGFALASAFGCLVQCQSCHLFDCLRYLASLHLSFFEMDFFWKAKVVEPCFCQGVENILDAVVLNDSSGGMHGVFISNAENVLLRGVRVLECFHVNFLVEVKFVFRIDIILNPLAIF